MVEGVQQCFEEDKKIPDAVLFPEILSSVSSLKVCSLGTKISRCQDDDLFPELMGEWPEFDCSDMFSMVNWLRVETRIYVRL